MGLPLQTEYEEDSAIDIKRQLSLQRNHGACQVRSAWG